MARSSSHIALIALGLMLGASAAEAQMVRKVLIIAVDGMRPDAMLAASCPNFDALISQGAFSQWGGVDGGDIESFFLIWEAGEAAADLNADGGIDGSDVMTFFERWELGC